MGISPWGDTLKWMRLVISRWMEMAEEKSLGNVYEHWPGIEVNICGCVQQSDDGLLLQVSAVQGRPFWQRRSLCSRCDPYSHSGV